MLNLVLARVWRRLTGSLVRHGGADELDILNEDDNEADEDELNRDSTWYVLSRFEQDIGSLVRKEGAGQRPPAKLAEGIKMRSRKSVLIDSYDDLVEASYFGDLFDLAVDLLPDNRKKDMQELKEKCQQFRVFEARNATAHPNRDWRSDFWTGLEGIVQDRVILKLGLRHTFEAYQKAKKMEVVDPPPSEDWMEAVQQFQVRNNLDEAHSIEYHPEFIGRKEERMQLARLLERNTGVVIVAPGGYGKTALVLNYLKEAVDRRLEKEGRYFDQVLFLSAKRYILEADGERILKQPKFHDAMGLRDEVASAVLGDNTAWKDATFGDKRVLLCLDNVDTLDEGERNSLVEFMAEESPPQWKVIATSRVDLNRVTPLHLSPMKPSDLKALGQKINRINGYNLTSDNVGDLAAKVSSPLALRIALELMQGGQGGVKPLLRQKPWTPISRTRYCWIMSAMT